MPSRHLSGVGWGKEGESGKALFYFLFLLLLLSLLRPPPPLPPSSSSSFFFLFSHYLFTWAGLKLMSSCCFSSSWYYKHALLGTAWLLFKMMLFSFTTISAFPHNFQLSRFLARLQVFQILLLCFLLPVLIVNLAKSGQQ
jgi:hypothetical protein